MLIWLFETKLWTNSGIASLCQYQNRLNSRYLPNILSDLYPSIECGCNTQFVVRPIFSVSWHTVLCFDRAETLFLLLQSQNLPLSAFTFHLGAFTIVLACSFVVSLWLQERTREKTHRKKVADDEYCNSCPWWITVFMAKF